MYDKHGKQSAMGEASGEDGQMMDPGQLFSQMFGGKAFEDWIGEISLGKEVSKAFEQAEEDEAEQTKVRRALSLSLYLSLSLPLAAPRRSPDAVSVSQVDAATKPAAAATTTATPQQGALHSEAHVESTGHSTQTSAPTSTAVPPPAAAGGVPTTSPTGASSTGAASPSPAAAAADSTPSSSSADAAHAHAAKSHLAGKPPKLTPEQKQKAYDDERKSYEEKRRRVETLAAKLRDRVRPFVDAREPGGMDDPETRRFAERMREETHDLAMESFGVGASTRSSFFPSSSPSRAHR